MTTAFLNLNGAHGAHSLRADLESVGINVIGHSELRGNLVQDIIRSAPDLVICYDPMPTEELFSIAKVIGSTAPRPIIVFTMDTDADKIEQATKSSIHAYVINGYGLHRLRSVVHLAQARFRHEQLLHEEFVDISNRFEERKLLDKAKGILMRARQISEDGAFQILRTASMQSNQRIGQVSQAVINSARFAESVNRAGQLRMLSQRLVKLYFLQLVDIKSGPHGQLLADSVLRIDANVAILKKSLSEATFGDFLKNVAVSWAALRSELQAAPHASHITKVDLLAEKLLQEADKLTNSLEQAWSVAPLHVINVSGRQRMLSQRFAKYALLMVLGHGTVRDLAEHGLNDAQAQFESALVYLNDVPLSTKAIRSGLDLASFHWKQIILGAMDIQSTSGRDLVADSSEALLSAFEQLTEQYERSMQVLVG